MKGKSWKGIALDKQLAFKTHLGLKHSGKTKTGEHESILTDEDAAAGANFYCYKNQTEWENLKAWAKESKGKLVNFAGSGLKNILRSEHIPYNLFYPLEKLRLNEPQLLNLLLENLMDKKIKVDRVTKIKIEYASDIHKSKLFNDKTSFDAYIEYLSNDSYCGIGIEVKYTEKSYPYGKTEEAEMNRPNSKYNIFTKECRYFSTNKIHLLKEKKLKQPWRNHLLGIKLVDIGALKQFHSLIIYPEGNKYQNEVCEQYTECLANEFKDTFKGLTFEEFNLKASDLLKSKEYKEWLSYLKERY